MPEVNEPVRRGLVLAGGGLKVAYQAGVLQVLLDEARKDGQPLDFVTADGASGGVFNLALWCQGLTGREIADRWRIHRPLHSVVPNIGLPFRPALMKSASIGARALPDLGIDLYEVKNGARGRLADHATFNVWDVTGQELMTFKPADLTWDLLVAGASPPMWFPAVRTGGRTYTDAVFASDGNLEAAIKSGANELWVIWTVSTRGRWRDGFNREYFQLVETAANSRLRADLARIKVNNAACAANEGSGEFRRKIDVRLLAGEVPVDYLLTPRRASIAKAVELGVRDARTWCPKQGLTLARPAGPPAGARTGELTFRETMKGYWVRGARDPRQLPDEEQLRIRLSLTIKIPDIARFVDDADHSALLTGRIRSAGWNRWVDVDGSIKLLKDGPDDSKQMVYTLRFTDPDGRRLRLDGVKYVFQGGFVDSWAETTTLYCRLTDVTSVPEVPIGAGVVRLSLPGFLHELTTFHANAPSFGDRVRTVTRFGTFFAGQLNDVRRERLNPPVAAPAWLVGIADR